MQKQPVTHRGFGYGRPENTAKGRGLVLADRWDLQVEIFTKSLGMTDRLSREKFRREDRDSAKIFRKVRANVMKIDLKMEASRKRGPDFWPRWRLHLLTQPKEG